jgi:hypothetical protein
MEKDDMEKIFSTHGEKMRAKWWSVNLKGRDSWGDLGVDWMTV